jgi:hypothetical protein
LKKGQTLIGTRLRNNLTNRFLTDLLTVYEKDGIGAIRSMRQENPTKFCIMVANLLPKDISLDITENKLNELPDADLDSLIDRVTDALTDTLRGRIAEPARGDEDGEKSTAH